MLAIWVWEFPEGKRKAFDNLCYWPNVSQKSSASLLQSQDVARKSTKERVPYITSLVFPCPQCCRSLRVMLGSAFCTRQNFIEEIT